MTNVSLPSTTPYFLEIIDQGEIDNDRKIINTFVPKINDALVKSLKVSSPLKDIYYNIDYCNFLNHQNSKFEHKEKDFSYIDKIFFKPKIKVPRGQCLNFDHPEVINLLLNNLSKYQNVQPMKIITPKQDKNNCWFNTSFIVFFVSDLGRKFSKYFRHYCVTGNIENVYQLDLIQRLSLFYLNIYIDSCLQGSLYSLYLNSNYIVNRIYKTFPYDKFIRDGQTKGTPIRYYYSLISKLNLNKATNFVPIYEFHLGSNSLKNVSDVIYQLSNSQCFKSTNSVSLKNENSFYI